MDLDAFAEHFTTHLPLTCLVYDNRNFGASDGLPRHEIIPSLQMSDIQDAITYAGSLDEVNADKIGIWGSSYSGGHVIQVGAFDRRVKVVLSQCPLISGVENSNRLVRSDLMPQIFALCAAGTISLPLTILSPFITWGPGVWAGVKRVFMVDRASRMKGEKPGVIPVITEDIHGMAALPTADSFKFFGENAKTKAPSWNNEVTIRRSPQPPSTTYSPTHLTPFSQHLHLCRVDLVVWSFSARIIQVYSSNISPQPHSS